MRFRLSSGLVFSGTGANALASYRHTTDEEADEEVTRRVIGLVWAPTVSIFGYLFF